MTRIRITVGLLMIVLALLFGGAGGYLIFRSQSLAENLRQSWRSADASCLANMERIGPLEPSGTSVTVRTSVARDWRVTLMDTSSVVAACPTRRMTYFCMGVDCVDPGSGTVPLEELFTTQANRENDPEARIARIRNAPINVVLRMTEVPR